ncbi:uncharacterized protein K444DRAFT_641659 [Hyaloscypha bicolor E]|uniref:Uncharacterized protein n=1 Tax=Hyaloscypha bicolor E TaxID=1095630 RepID=A0A2J6TGQ7_9HELO|nr:uncharacterized protein K444DRAFT_641659 [Hyaloscypha bicolor E]PMD62222.1 hypothetical protein K444DRAFT_641659 [Hyaloscypha bicolor E]
MADEDSRPTHWAVLIGVGLTILRTKPGSLSSGKDRSLKGVVQDIIAISEYLKEGLSTLHQDEAVIPIETPGRLPSPGNVTLSFKRILDLAKPGNHVYIHYSGHGTRRNFDCAVALRAHPQKPGSLELIHPSSYATEYLYGTVLRNAISQMIRIRLSVTLATNVEVRYIEHDSDIDAESEYTDPFAETLNTEERGGVVNLARLLGPEGYAIIAACGPHEVASELEFESGVRRGALSYFLVDTLSTLRKSGVKISNQTHHQHLRAQFHVRLPEQTPMLYGNRGFSFFGDFTDHPHLSMASMHRSLEDGSLILHAEQVHGVHNGDEYALSLFESPENPPAMNSQPIRSKLVTLDPNDMEKIWKGSVWKAALVTSLSPRKIHIQLNSNVPDRDGLIQAAQSSNFLVPSRTEEINQDLVLVLENLTDHPLYLTLFILTEFWEVHNLVSERGEDICLLVLPRVGRETGKLELPLAMSVPEELQRRSQKQTEDVVKIFITSQSSMFPGLLLLKLGHDSQLRGEPDPLQKLLQVLNGGSWRGWNAHGCEWTTRSYFIRTHI